FSREEVRGLPRKVTHSKAMIRSEFHDILPNSQVDALPRRAKTLEGRIPFKANRSVLAPDVLNRTTPLARVLDQVPDAILVVSARPAILFLNRSAEIAFGYSLEEIRGKSLMQVLPGGLRGFRCNAAVSLAHLDITKMERLEVVGLRKDSREFPLEAALFKF